MRKPYRQPEINGLRGRDCVAHLDEYASWEEFCRDVTTIVVSAGSAPVFSSMTADGVARLSIERGYWKRDPEAKR